MKLNNKSRVSTSILSRRGFIQTGALISASLSYSVLGGCGSPTEKEKTVKSSVSSKVLYSSDFIPDGASLTLAFVADHHYWPNHFKNWGSKQFRYTEARMRDLIVTLNDETPDVSIHGGDVIDAGTAFVPPLDEYIEQLDYEKEMLDALKHPAIPIVGNHEVPDAHYESESELDHWKERFGALYRYTDINGWRLVCLNTMVPNPGGESPVYGIDDIQLQWLAKVLDDAASNNLKALLFAHIPPDNYTYKNTHDFGKVIASTGCVKGMVTGHIHRNERYSLNGIPVMVRASNVASPLAYTMVYPYPDGRIVVVQKSQHFPFINYMSNIIQEGLQGKENDRYYTLNGSSEMPLTGLTVKGNNAHAEIKNGRLSLESKEGKGMILIDKPELTHARISFSVVKEGATHIGAVACAGDSGSARIEAVLTSEYGTDGNMFLAAYRENRKETLDRSWFNIADGIAYKCVLEARNGTITFSPKNMPELSAAVKGNPSGKFGFFVENGKMLVTDLKLEKLG